MWRTGILTREHFLGWERAGGLEHQAPRVSLQLLDIGEGPYSDEDIHVFEGVSRLTRTSSGIYRTTYRQRLAELDAAGTRWMREIFSRDEEIVVEDRAASHGLTSAEWAESLVLVFPKLRLIASDLLLFLIEAKRGDRQLFILEPDGTPLQCIQPPFVLPLSSPESKRYPLNRWMVAAAARRLSTGGEHALRIPPEWVSSQERTSIHFGSWRLRKISMVHPSAREMEAHPHFRVEHGSVFDVSSVSHHLIRTMNILTLRQFPKDRLSQAVRSIHASLVEGGVWVVGRTVEEEGTVHQASIFQKRGGSFWLLEQFGSGWEAESLALSFAN